MKKISTLLVLLMMIRFVNAQNCDPTTPVFNIDLTGQPNGTWTSTPVVRNGLCCSASGSDKCLQFNITLDSSAQAINFNITSGAVPGGALFYQINCGTPQTLGTPICLNGPGPYIITFCKPGNNVNTYAISSIGQPELQGTQWVSQACSGFMSVSSLVESSITWSSVPANPLYDSFLSCTSNCDSVIVQATVGSSLPAFIDYRVCGTVAGICGSPGFCDTIRINFVNDLLVSITPVDPVLCFGISDTVLTAIASGGLAPYTYSWNNGATTQNIRVGPGTYIVSINDSRNCSVANDTVIVTQVASLISANAGTDIDICAQAASALLSGSITTASGALWTGGLGAFNPDSTSLSATYIPSSTEISNGIVSLTLTTTGNSGCPAASDQMQIRIFQNPNVSISGPTSICLNRTSVYTTPYNGSNTYTWTITGGLIIQNNINSITVLWNITGTGNILLLVQNSNGCDSTVNYAVNVNPLPSTTITGSYQNCTPGNFIYQATLAIGSQYLWTATNGIIFDPSVNPITINYSGTGTSVINVTETDINGCVATATQSVQFIQRPAPVISGSTSVCFNQTQTYSVPLVAGISSTWSVTGGAITSSSSNEITVVWNSVGIGTVTLQQSSFPSCDTTITFNVTIHPNPIGSISGNSNACSGHSESYSTIPYDSSVTYTWSLTGSSAISSATLNSCILNYGLPGNDTLTINMSTINGCVNSQSFPIEIYQQPSPILYGATQVCAGSVNTYICQSGATNSWTITGGTVQSISGDSVVVEWNIVGQGSVTLYSTNLVICDTTITLSVDVLPVSAPIIIGNATICSNRPVQFVVSGATNSDQILWNFTAGTFLSGITNDTLLILFSDTGNENISVTLTNSNGCDSTINFPITLLDGPAPAISGPLPLCVNNVATYSVPAKQGHSYVWSVIGGSVVGFVIDNTVEVLWSAAGQGSVTCRQTSPDGCDSIAFLMVPINPLPTPIISGPTQICQNETATFLTGMNSGSVYQWMINGNPSSQTGSEIQDQWPSTGSYSIQVNETNSSGCPMSDMVTLVVTPKPAAFINGSPKACISDGIQNYFVAGQANTIYDWTIDGGGSIVSPINSDSIKVSWTIPGLHTITLVATDAITGCDSTIRYAIYADTLQKPVVASSVSGCEPVTLNVSGNTMDPSYRFIWNFGDGTTSSLSNPSHQYSVPGLYSLIVISENGIGCKDTSVASIKVMPSPNAYFTIKDYKDYYMAEVESIQLINQSDGASTYNWMLGNGITSNLFQPNMIYDLPGVFIIELYVSNIYGCKDTFDLPIEIRVPENVFVPNSFTPNGDDKNDYFSMSFMNIKEASISIFNRWGEEIYTSHDTQFHWDGTYKGRPVQQEVYVYIIDAVGFYGTEIRKVGKLSLIR